MDDSDFNVITASSKMRFDIEWCFMEADVVAGESTFSPCDSIID
jgi:hypothetical protein